MTWLHSLPAHPIFDLPSSSAHLQPPPTAASELPRPSSPFASSSSAAAPIFPLPAPSHTPQQYSSNTARDVQSGAAAAAGGRKRKMMVLARGGNDLILAAGREVRIKSLAEYKGRWEEAHMDVQDGGEHAEQDYGGYKVLSTPLITFTIHSLELNNTGKLLAVIGEREIVVVVLPRKGWQNRIGGRVECRSLLVGPSHHSLPTSPLLASVLFHPLGRDDATLVVLASTGIIYEYALDEDPLEPSRTINFTAPTSSSAFSNTTIVKKAVGGFSAIDEEESIAVSMCFGQGEGDWGRMTLYVAWRNGDLKAVCPFLPARASLPLSYIHSLAHFVRTKVDYLASLPPPSFPSSSSRTNPLPSSTFSADQSTREEEEEAAEDEEREREELRELYARQMKFVNALLRQVSSASGSSSRTGASARRRKRSPLAASTPFTSSRLFSPSTSSFKPQAENDDDQEEEEDEIDNEAEQDDQEEQEDLHRSIALINPSSTNTFFAHLAIQGPFLFQPAPLDFPLREGEDEGDAERGACDLLYVLVRRRSGSAGSGAAGQRAAGGQGEGDGEGGVEAAGGGGCLGILLMSHSEGKIDIFLEVEKLEPRWSAPSSSSVGAGAMRVLSKSLARSSLNGSFGSRFRDQEEEEGDGLEGGAGRRLLPVLVSYETIDLGLLASSSPSSAHHHRSNASRTAVAAEPAWTTLVSDPFYADTVYVYHAQGVHCLLMTKWVEKLLGALEHVEGDDEIVDGDNDEEDAEEKRVVQRLRAAEQEEESRTEVVSIVETVSYNNLDDGDHGSTGGLSGAATCIEAVSLLHDVYLGYAFLALTRSLQLVTIPLTLRVELPSLTTPLAASVSTHPSSTNPPTTAAATKGYNTLLTPAFVPPPLLSHTPLPRHPQQLSTPASSSSSAPLEITPASLRALGTAIEGKRGGIRELVLAGEEVQSRVGLLIREGERQGGKLREVKQLLEGGTGGGDESERIERVKLAQTQLLHRLDKLLRQTDVLQHRPLTPYEQKWIEELGRLERVVVPSLEGRVGGVGRRWEEMREGVRGLESSSANTAAEKGRDLGKRQREAVESALSDEARLIIEVRKKIDRLSATLKQVTRTA